MEPGVYAYFVEAEQHTPDSIRLCLGQLELDSVWLRIHPLQLPARSLLMLELFDLESGGPLDVPRLGQLLSAEGRRAFLAAVDPTDRGAAFEAFRDGAELLAFSGEWDSYHSEEHGEGREGFARMVLALSELDWGELVAAAARAPRFLDEADDHTEVFIRGRLVGIPEGMPRQAALFGLHYGDADDDADETDEGDETDEAAAAEDDTGADDAGADEAEDGDEEEPDGEGQMMLMLLDPELSRFLWEEAPAAQVSAFLQALEPVRGAVLGPLAHALPDVIHMVQAQLPDRPLGRSPLRELLVYEVLSMATGVGYLAGDAVEYYDRLFFPLINLIDGPIVDALRASLEEIRDMGLLQAMVEVLPYSAPEGELLESFGDEELTPLASWAEEDDVYEGALFLLDDVRLRRQMERFDVQRLTERVQQFRQAWADLLPPGNQWHAGEADSDQADLERFGRRVRELRQLLALAEVNRLQPAVLFYD